MAGTGEALHLVILPWLAFGHMIPLLNFAVALAAVGIRISFISTPRNTRRLPRVPAHLAPLVKFIDFELPPVDGLPQEAEATVDVSFAEIQFLKIAYDSLKDPIRHFVEQQSPDYILHDFAPHWIPGIEREFNVPCIFFSVFSAATLCFSGPLQSFTLEGQRRWRPSPKSMTVKPDWVPFPSSVMFRPGEAEGFYHGVYDMNASGVTDADRMRTTIEGSVSMAVRSCREFEGQYLELLEKLCGRPVIPIGLLPPECPPQREVNRADENDGWGKVFKWLDKQKPKSVVFVSFGSELKLSESQVHEIAHGLEMSGVPFLWALRRPAWVSGGDEEALPEGFVGRTQAAGQGVVCFGWAPQLEILAHPSVGGSFFHSGWGSIIETLSHGHALVLLPSIIDQPLNARLLVEKGLGVEAEKNDDGSFNRNKIAEALVKGMMGEEGEEIRVKARETGPVFGDAALHDGYVKGFVEYLLHNKQSAT